MADLNQVPVLRLKNKKPEQSDDYELKTLHHLTVPAYLVYQAPNGTIGLLKEQDSSFPEVGLPRYPLSFSATVFGGMPGLRLPRDLVGGSAFHPELPATVLSHRFQWGAWLIPQHLSDHFPDPGRTT